MGPENPLRVEKDDAAQLHCNVDSKPTGNKYALKRYDPIYTPQYTMGIFGSEKRINKEG